MKVLPSIRDRCTKAREGRLVRHLKLRKVDVSDLTWRRVACGRGFAFRDHRNKLIRAPDIRDRCVGLAIPPAWQDVRIAPDERAHIQAVGRDDAGRLQYIYHPDWEEVRASRKGERLKLLACVLPALRRTMSGHLRDRELSRGSILSAAVTLIDRAALRAGHEEYAGDESGRGAATLLKRHAIVEDGIVLLDFPGKGGRRVRRSVAGKLLARKIGALKLVPGARLFKERDGRLSTPLTADDVNAYLRSETGSDITAKDFRTFHASALALERLCGAGQEAGESPRTLAAVCREVAELLQNTPAVCRASYIHPGILDAFEDGMLAGWFARGRPRPRLTRAETALLRFLDSQAEA